jgi:hypothetical protein
LPSSLKINLFSSFPKTSLAEMFYHCSEDKKLEHVRNWLKRPPRALPKCYLDWVKQLPEDEKQTLRDFC